MRVLVAHADAQVWRRERKAAAAIAAAAAAASSSRSSSKQQRYRQQLSQLLACSAQLQLNVGAQASASMMPSWVELCCVAIKRPLQQVVPS
jgi:hypothetical protein